MDNTTDEIEGRLYMTEDQCERWFMENFPEDCMTREMLIENLESGLHIELAEQEGYTIKEAK